MKFYFSPALVFLLCFYLPCSPVQAQPKESYFDYKWEPSDAAAATYFRTTEKTDSGYLVSDYYFQKHFLQSRQLYSDADLTNKIGSYVAYHPNKMIKSQGRYSNNKEDGLLTSYHMNGLMKDSTVYESGYITGISLGWHANGYMSDSTFVKPDGSMVLVSWFDNGSVDSAGMQNAQGKKIKTWQYFNREGILTEKEIWDDGSLIKTYSYTDDNKELEEIMPATEAIFPGGDVAYRKYVRKNMYFPVEFEFKNSNHAFLVVTFTVDEQGKVSDAYVSTPLHPKFDAVVLSAIKKMPDWKPAISHNRTVKSRLQHVTHFVMGGGEEAHFRILISFE